MLPFQIYFIFLKGELMFQVLFQIDMLSTDSK